MPDNALDNLRPNVVFPLFLNPMMPMTFTLKPLFAYKEVVPQKSSDPFNQQRPPAG
jgi:hypothetical protein